jgi:hypothetical protein
MRNRMIAPTRRRQCESRISLTSSNSDLTNIQLAQPHRNTKFVHGSKIQGPSLPSEVNPPMYVSGWKKPPLGGVLIESGSAA